MTVNNNITVINVCSVNAIRPMSFAITSLDLIQLYQVLAVCIICISCLILGLMNIYRAGDPLWKIPGPPCLPLIGSVLSMGTKPHLYFTSQRKRYGDIFRVQIGSLPVVIINGFKVSKEALVHKGDVFSGRPGLFTFKLASEGTSMAFNSFSPKWKIHRRLAERALKITTEKTHFVKDVVNREARILTDQLLSVGKVQDPARCILWSVANAMYSLCYGDSRTCPDFMCMIDSTLRLIHCHKLGNILNFFPWTRIFLRSTYNELREICGNMMKTTKIQEQKHLETYKEGTIRDALDALIQVNRQRQHSLPDNQVLHTVQEFIGAGMDIVYMSLSWALLFMSKYPDKRQMVVEEVDRILGADRERREADLKNMPVTHAFILETLRYSSVVPFTLPHATLQDTEIGGYTIPAGTFVLVNLHSLHSDPDVWGDPEVFRPERFLSATGTLDEAVVSSFCPFGLGRRRCVGDNISKHQLFVYITVLLQRCTFIDPPTPEAVHIGPGCGILLKPDPYMIQLDARS